MKDLQPEKASQLSENVNTTEANLVVFAMSADNSDIEAHSFNLKANSLASATLIEIKDEEFLKECAPVRVIHEVSLTVDKSRIEGSIKDSVESLISSFLSLSLNMRDSKYSIQLNSKVKKTVLDLYNEIEDKETHDIDDLTAPNDLKKKMKEKLAKKRVSLKLPLVFSSSKVAGDELEQIKELSLADVTSFKVKIDVLMFMVIKSSIAILAKSIHSAMIQQLRQISLSLIENSGDAMLPLVECYNCYLKDVTCHFVSVVYSINKADEDLVEMRTKLHKSLVLPMNRPVIRRTNQYTENITGYLWNTHEGLKSGLKGGIPSIVFGTYTYHHYMQDNFDDNQWGCAYRSLQTVVSWFRHQGYTSKPIPTHKDIQQALVDVGDKEPSFVGSRKWIGSQEVGFVLNHLYGVTSKVMFVNAGSELADKGRELSHHFETQGTPIMIGGGCLAHTIIGVDFNAQKGDLRFLILDPHYTGGEDLVEIQKKVSRQLVRFTCYSTGLLFLGMVWLEATIFLGQTFIL